MPSIPAKASDSAKKMAQMVAKQLAQEPLEILKDASSQIMGVETARQPDTGTSQQPENTNQQKKIQEQQQIQDKMRSSRRIEAYQRELEDIRKQDVFKDLQQRIANGEEISLQDYPELSLEQRQVLNAQMEVVRFQHKQSEYMESQKGGSLFGSAKKSRRMGSNQKQEAEKQQTRVEKPVPPSG